MITSCNVVPHEVYYFPTGQGNGTNKPTGGKKMKRWVLYTRKDRNQEWVPFSTYSTKNEALDAWNSGEAGNGECRIVREQA